MLFNPSEDVHMETQGAQYARIDAATFPPLEQVNRPAVPTEQAAFYLMRRPQTLRLWACSESGPLRPTRLNGRLAWPVAEIRSLLGV